ncbi:MAG: elongation factor G [Pseudomonadota bacterium]
MKQYDTPDLRNIALIGHKGAGKTTLAEAMLFCGKSTTRLGSVLEHNTVMDFEPEEQRREMSIGAGAAFIEHGKRKLNVLDTPGEPNFFYIVQNAIHVCEGAVVVVGASEGVQAGTEKAFLRAQEKGLSVAIFATKMEREQADLTTLVKDIKENLTPKAAALQLPIGKEAEFGGVVDLLSMKAHIFKKDNSGDSEVGDIPADLLDAASEARATLIEEIATADDALLEKYLESGELDEKETMDGLKKAIAGGKLVPVLCGISSSNMGVRQLMDMVAETFPSPADRGVVAGLTTEAEPAPVDIERAPDQPFVGYVFNTYTDQMGVINCIRVFRGQGTADTAILNTTRSGKERFGSLVALVGKKQEALPLAACGDIFAVVKMKDTRTGDTLTAEKGTLTVKGPSLPPPAITFAVRGKSKGDEDKIGAGLHRLAIEDPTLKTGVDARSKDTLVSGVGQVHIEVVLEKLKRRTGIEVELLPPKVPYRETIKKKVANVEGKHKKQTGGRGQFGVCYIDVEPAPRGAGLEFVNDIFGGAIPRQFIPAIEKGVREKMDRGVIAGYPLVDVKVRLFDGKYHDVDSDSRSFEMAGSKGMQAAVKEAAPCLLEPIMNVEVTAPEDCMGDVIGDMNSRRGRIQGTDSKGKAVVVKAQVPMAEMLKYASDLRSITQARGSFAMELSHYDEVPAQIAEKVIAENKMTEDEDD